MDIKETEMMLNLLATNRINDLKNYLLDKRKKYYTEKLSEEYNKLAYSTFLKFMCDLNSTPHYSYSSNNTIFNDNISLFVINKKFEIGIDPCDVNFSLNTLKRVKEMISDKGVIDNKYKELSYYILKRGELSYKFNSIYYDYLTTFIGKDALIYIDKYNPIAYSESEHGMGFILGRKNK